jgi:hypothetical protein
VGSTRKAGALRAGTDLDEVDVRVTLVRLTALQDQHFDLTELDRGVEPRERTRCVGRG